MSDQLGEFRNGLAIVAGGSGGIGAAICEKLASRGVDVAFTYHRSKDNADRTCQRIEKHGRRSMAVQVDLKDAAAVTALVAKVSKDWGEPSTVVYAAGPLLRFRYIAKIESELFREVMETDVVGCFNLMHAAIPALRATRGAFVAMSTPAIDHYVKKDILSIAPKAAIHALIRGIAVEEGRYGVRANSVGIGLVGDAGLFDTLVKNGDIDDRFVQTTYEQVPLQRLGKADEIAEATAFLASERASFVTGQLLMVDGGLAA